MTNAIIKAIAVLAVTGSMAFAQLFPPRQGDLAVSIPFDFEANGKRMQAGEYIVRADAERGVLHVCEDGVYCVTVEISNLKRDSDDGEPQLVFTKQGNRYVLSMLLCEKGNCWELPLLESVALDAEFERVKARKLVIHQIPGIPVAWS